MGETASKQPVRVLIVDDHRVLTELLTSALSINDSVTVVGSVGTAVEGVRSAASLHPDVVILDYDLPDADGVSVIESMNDACPNARVLMLTSYTDPAVLSEAMSAGCSGFITKRNGASEILAAVLAVASGDTPVSPDMVSSLVGRDPVGLGSDLTDREIEVLRIASKGRSNKEIAAELFLSVNTVRNHMQHVLNKLGAHSKLEATAIAAQIGILRR